MWELGFGSFDKGGFDFACLVVCLKRLSERCFVEADFVNLVCVRVLYMFDRFCSCVLGD